MRRDQLEHAIRTACQIIGRSEVIVVGSQSILGTFSQDELPADATMSIEVDILPIADDNDETVRLADLIEGVAGELSPFEELHGFSIDGVDLETSVLPAGWRARLVKVQNANTAPASGEPQFTGWCLDKEDLCVAKLSALREPELRRRTCPRRPRRRDDHPRQTRDRRCPARRVRRTSARVAARHPAIARPGSIKPAPAYPFGPAPSSPPQSWVEDVRPILFR